MRTEAAQNFKVILASCGGLGFALLFLFAMLLEASSAWAQHQAELVVATREVPPFAIHTDKGWEGIAIELWTRVATLPSSTSEAFLSRHLIPYRGFATLSGALAALDRGQTDAVVYDAPILRYLVAEHYPASLSVLPQILQRQDYGFAFPSGSPLREQVDRALLEIIQSPEWKHLLERYLGRGA